MSTAPKASRRQVIAALIDMLEAGKSVRQVARTLAAYLVEIRQTRNAELYIRDFELAAAERFGVTAAYVYSASELSDKVRKQVEQLVKAKSGTKAVEMVEKIKPELIGGIIIKTADAELDGSVRTKLRNLRSV